MNQSSIGLGEFGSQAMKAESLDYGQASVDISCLEELRDITSSNGDLRQFNRILETFQDALKTQLESMRCAVEARTAEDMANLAHSLKGSAASIGAGQLALLCAALETVALRSAPGEPEHLLCQIESEAQLVTQVLEYQKQKY